MDSHFSLCSTIERFLRDQLSLSTRSSRFMKRFRGGFRLGRRLARVWRCVLSRLGRRRAGGGQLILRRERSRLFPSGVASRLLDWGRSVSRGLRFHRPLERRRMGDQAPLLKKEEEERPPPKGHLAVYVGRAHPPRRYVVPVVYFNHPLFGELLREAEEEFGFEHPGGITIPCPAAKFELVRTRVAADSKSSSRGEL